MEAWFKELAAGVALAAELVCVLCILVGGISALVQAGAALIAREASHKSIRRAVWRTFAVWIVLALEFALAADIVRTAIAPSWSDIGQLAAIAAIRTALNFFLERDMEALDSEDAAEPSPPEAPARIVAPPPRRAPAKLRS